MLSMQSSPGKLATGEDVSELGQGCPACKYMGKTVLTREAYDALLQAGRRPEAGQLAPHGEWRCGNIAPFIGKWVEDHPSSGMTAAELTIPIDNPLEVYAAHRQMLGLPLE